MSRLGWAAMLSAALVIAGSAARAEEAGRGAVELSRLNADKLIGKPWLHLKRGLVCLPNGKEDWKAKDSEGFSHSAMLLAAFRDELSKAGFRSGADTSDLFAAHTENVEIQVGGLVNDLQVDLCTSHNTIMPYQTGHASMDIEWQIYSTTQGRIIGRVPTHAVMDVPPSSDGEQKLLRGVFAASARALANSPEFIEAVKASHGGSATAPQTSRSPLQISLPPATGPLSFDQAQKGVVSIFTADAFGSGVLISPEGYILTNHHVAGDVGRVRVRWPNGVDTVGEVVRADKRRDVALIKTSPPAGAPALAIRHTDPRLGETVFALGTPLEREFAGTLTRGVVSTVRRIENGLPFIQSDVAVDHGNSGGPLLDEQGHVLGLTDWGYSPDGVSHNLNFFIPIDEALRALALSPAG